MLRFLLPGLWFGSLTGLGELGYVAARKYGRGLFVFHGPDIVWMTPLATAALFTVAALMIGVAAWRWPARVTSSGTVGVFVGLGVLSLLLLFPPLHWAAALTIALGLGVQAARLAGPWERRLARAVKASTWPLLGVIALAGAGGRGLQWWAERRALAALPEGGPGRPNVLVLVLDTVRAINLSLYGYHRPTSPALAGFARQGVRFDRALATSPWTLPSHASLFTGLWAHQQTTDWFKPLQRDVPTLAEVLSRQGYRTAGFVANVWYCGRETGLARGFTHYEDHQVTWGTFLTSASLLRKLRESRAFELLAGERNLVGRKSAARINRDFLRWLDADATRPFFAFLNYYDAHAPYLPPDGYLERFATPGIEPVPQLPTGTHPGGSWSAAQIQGALDAYDGALAYLDAQIARLLSELEARGVLSRTIVVITSDHGEEFNEHGLIHHGHSLYRASVHVPLVVVWPGHVPPDRVVPDPVSLRDVPATILALAGVEAAPAFPGRSLSRFWTDPPAPGADTLLSELKRVPLQPAWYPGSKGDMAAVVHGGLRYIREADGRERLFRVVEDPLEREDLSPAPDRAGDLRRFREILRTMGALP
ncbi:MAG TPA: sulfatase [Gemmatimonadales bacterium]|nr:sulfatase [Gemmatimonadales bacterium]